MIKILFYHFTYKEVLSLHKLINHMWVDAQDEELTKVLNHICKIVENNELLTRDNQAT